MRAVNIAGLDLQASGSMHVASSREAGWVVLKKTRDGANNKRIN